MPDFSTCLQADETQVGDDPVTMSLDDGAQASFAHAASLGEAIEPALAAMLAARSRSPQPAVVPGRRGVSSTRATAPGLASDLINTIRDGREARAEAAEAREESAARRGTRQRVRLERFTPPE